MVNTRLKMATYGKKRSRFAEFSIFRDTNSEANGKSKNKECLVQTPVVPDFGEEVERDDSIAKMANELLNDTTDDTTSDLTDDLQHNPKHLSQIRKSETAPNLGAQSKTAQVNRNKLLPPLPTTTFNGDDVWAFRNSPVVTADGRANTMHFDDYEGSNASAVPTDAPQKFSPTAVPHKSSKRNSVRAEAQLGGTRKQARKEISHPTNFKLEEGIQKLNAMTPPNEIKEKLNAATRNLKGAVHSQVLETTNTSDSSQSIPGARKTLRSGIDQSLLRGSYVSTKFGRMGKEVLTKMKSTTIDIFQFGNSRSRHNSARDERLLDPSSTECQEVDGGKMMEAGSGEGKYLKKPEVYKGPAPLWNSLALHPITSEIQFGDGMDLDESARFKMESKLPSHSTEISLYAISSKTSYSGEFDAILSSSPDGQSTPRLRPEPLFETSTNSTQNVHTGFHPLFDPHSDLSYGLSSNMDIEYEQAGDAESTEDRLKRKRFPETLSSLKRSKKHPSPPIGDLAQWGLEMDKIHKKKFGDDADAPFQAAGGLMSVKYVNKKVMTDMGRTHTRIREGLSNAASVPNLGEKGLKSSMRKQATETGDNLQSVSYLNVAHGSMDEDELQWTETQYDIQTRKP